MPTFRIVVLISTLVLAVAAAADAQVTREEFEALKSEVGSLTETVKAQNEMLRQFFERMNALREGGREAPFKETPVSIGDAPVFGKADAKVTIVEFSDYQCPFCARVNPTLAKVRETYGDRVKIVFKDYPLPNHPQAPKAAEAARCAGEQKKYWEMHDAMFANQRALEVPALKQTARAIGLDGAAFDQCLDSGKWAATIQKGSELGDQMGVNSTPTLYVNGRALIGAMPFENFKSIIDEELAKK
jgi:protein-disulfide isomerase